ncbi:peptidylprolyl isomerase [Bacillus subtilis subsp. globigii]|uniref:Peptidyl-prolyl cis-trans isomerase n=1 Tax=Bacillus atrophaeus (strain 1942) TaxID=720555 RepID=A0ABM5LYY6_BACA1|nr:peptidyl-prolyl isomerase [Bacillus atrophaeus 1942]AMR62290.1 peptidylprolyl isomerase [Bacillus subtilis subsp. globigii]ASS71722.1 peptidyl-prolyl cis-trans isomerase [Bacillus atrophaeus]EIM12289.1 peptidyl-prolyl isomerase [Bacillus atrophaeus C89]MDR4397205.1 peptidyl-prolyl cis-trans isomerase [Bacillus atrophaeus]
MQLWAIDSFSTERYGIIAAKRRELAANKYIKISFKNLKIKKVGIQLKTGYFLLEDGNKIEFELYPEEAPGTVANFEKLANEGFYDGVTFHRVIPGFVSQGGDPTGTGTEPNTRPLVSNLKSLNLPSLLSSMELSKSIQFEYEIQRGA